MTTGHHQDHREQSADRDRSEDPAWRPQASAAARRHAIEIRGHPVRVDDRDEAIHEKDQVEDEEAGQDPRGQDEGDQLGRLHSQSNAGDQGHEQDQRGREAERSLLGTRVEVAQARKEEGEEGGNKGRSPSRPRLLRALHRG